MNERQLFDVPSAAKALGIKPRDVLALIENGELRASIVGLFGKTQIPRSELERFINTYKI